MLLLAPACGAGSGPGGLGTGQSGNPGDEDQKPDGSGTFFVDPNQNGAATHIKVSEMFWGRLVDVFDIDPTTGDANPSPVFRDFVINENIQTDQTNYVLETNPITERTRLVIQRQKGAADNGNGTFSTLLLQATRNLPPILPKNDDGSSSEPFSFIARNACLVIRVDDLLDDADVVTLQDEIRVLVNYPPTTPFQPRILFDPNHGGIAYDRAFHTSRILVDMTVSEAEASGSSFSLAVNSLGLPASVTTSGQPNVSCRIPSKVDFNSGTFSILRNVRGGGMDTEANGPVDFSSPTLDIVRAMRAGNSEDQNNGFLLDLNQPEILGSWAATINSASPDPTGTSGFDFVVDLQFTTTCQGAPRVGDILQVGSEFLEVTEPGIQPQNGDVPGLRVRVLTDDPVTNTNRFLGVALFQTTYSVASTADVGCWLTISPQAKVFPLGGVSPNVQATVRFSEPMDPGSVAPYDSFLLVRGSSAITPSARSIVVGEVNPESDLKAFTYVPVLPLAHTGAGEQYHFELIGGTGGATDLAGNALKAVFPFVDFDIDTSAPPESNGGLVLRFSAVDEVDPNLGFPDIRGQFFYDLAAGRIRPRPVAFRSLAADRSVPVPSIMIAFPPGVQTPLTPLGSKLQTIWRYVDVGFSCDDESNFNLDVMGLNWSPIGGTIVGDIYDRFEIRLSHSVRLPDEEIDLGNTLLPLFPDSGLLGKPALFTDNILLDPRSPLNSQVVVHPRTLGYVVDPATIFQSVTGTVLVPFPLNRSTQTPSLYTWRDTSITSRGGPNGAGIPEAIESRPPLLIDPRPEGSVALPGFVPSFGLPLLMEYRCFPNTTGIGLNALDISLAVNSSAKPNFRAFSTGGIDSSGNFVSKDPDMELVPSGGFNPSSTPPGQPTQFTADNSFYIGQMDVVVRVSRVHTIFLDTQLTNPNYFTPILEPAIQPDGTSVVIEYRAATGFDALAGDAPFDATRIDPYGDPRDDLDGNSSTPPDLLGVDYLNGDSTWKPTIDSGDGARYLQLRITFLNNVLTGLNPDLSGIGIAYESQ